MHNVMLNKAFSRDQCELKRDRDMRKSEDTQELSQSHFFSWRSAVGGATIGSLERLRQAKVAALSPIWDTNCRSAYKLFSHSEKMGKESASSRMSGPEGRRASMRCSPRSASPRACGPEVNRCNVSLEVSTVARVSDGIGIAAMTERSGGFFHG